jgi:phosphoribosyl 1,2-cyclic phosphodiesterase
MDRMILRNLGSGSGGNASLVEHAGRAILIDAGLRKERILPALQGLKLEGVLITHRHSDHLGRESQRLGAPVWIEKANWEDARRLRWIGDDVEHFAEEPFRLGPFRVTPFALPHPGNERWNSYGFRVECWRRRIAYATDLGSVPAEVVEALSGAHVVFLESNHDADLECRSGRAPGHIKWVLSDHGHLSNEQCAEALSQIGKPHTVVLGHLSRDCNSPELALGLARKALPRSVRVFAARQDVATDPVTV